MKKVFFLMKIKEKNSNNYSPAMFNWYGILEYLGYEVSYIDYDDYEPQKFYELVKKERPNYIFHPTYENIHTEFIRLREYSKVYCIHSDDDWRFDNYTKYWIPFTDGSVGYQSSNQKYINEGASKNYYNRSRWTFNPNMMYFNFITNKEYELSHVGGLHGNKKEKLAQLTSKGLDISLIDPKFTSYSDYLEAYHKSVASICLTSNSVNTGPQSKTRLAELPYYCVLVSEPWPNMEMWNMEPNKDFILIDESDNYVELIQKCFRDKNFCENMYQSAKSILINSNTVFHEWNRIMRNIDEDYTEIDVNKLMDNFNLQ